MGMIDRLSQFAAYISFAVQQKSNPLFAFDFSSKGGWDLAQRMPLNFKGYAKEGYRRNDTVFKCISYIARNGAGVEWGLYTDKTKQKEITSHPLLDLWANPNPDQYTFDYVEDWISFYLLTGNVFQQSISALSKDPKSIPDEMYVLRPDYVQIVPSEAGVVGYKLGNDVSIAQPIDKSAIAHSKYWCPDDFYWGLSPLEVAAIFIDQQSTGNKWNLAYMSNAVKMPGFWKTDQLLNQIDFQKLKRDLKEKYAGYKNAGNSPLFDGGVTWQEASKPPLELDWMGSSMKLGISIANLFNLDPALIGDTSASTYNNRQEAKYGSYTEAIFPCMDKLSASLNRWLVPRYGKGLYLAYKPESVSTIQEIIQQQLQAKSDRSTKIWMAGKCTMNEARDLEGLPPVDGGDCFRFGSVLVPEEKLEEYAEQSLTKPAAPPPAAPEPLNVPAPGQPGNQDDEEPAKSAAKFFRQRIVKAVDTDDDDEEEEHTGIMVAFFLDPKTAEQLAIPDGLSSDELHITLAYMGDTGEDTDPDKEGLNPATSPMKIKQLLASFASEQKPLEGKVAGVGRFTSVSDGEPTPVYASVDIPGLAEFRTKLVEQMQAINYFVDTTHGFTPHITLAYIDADEPMPVENVPDLPLSFDTLWLAVGDDHYSFPIGDQPPPKKSRHTKALDLSTTEQKQAFMDSMESTRAKWEDEASQRLEDYFKQEQKLVVSAVEQAAIPASAIDRAELALKQLEPHFKDIISKLWQDVAQDVGSQVAKDLKSQYGAHYQYKAFSSFAPNVLTYLLALAGRKVVGINATTLDMLQKILHFGVMQGESIPQLAKRVDSLYLDQIIPNRSTVIARTEVVAASNYGSHESAKQSGLTLKKVWLSTSDNRTRPDHVAADGQTVGMDEPFQVGGSQLMFPGDNSLGAAADEIIQCRCTQFYKRVPAPAVDTVDEEEKSHRPISYREFLEAYI